MIIDISSYNGKIDWQKVSKQDIDGVILRSTTQNGKLDTRLIENYNGILQNMNNKLNWLAFYKFSYVRTYAKGRIECLNTIDAMQSAGIRPETIDRFYLDLEMWDGREYTREEADEVILAYADQCHYMGVPFGLYSNYNYIKNILNPVWRFLPLWIARYNTTLGDVKPWQPDIWQYTSKGQIDGIPSNVDISRRLHAE